MRSHRRLRAAALSLAVLLSACTAGESAPATARSSPEPSGHAARSDELLADNLAADEPGCSAAVGIDGEVVWAGARGIADLSADRPIDTSTEFAIASVSKQFTATAVLLLAHEGRLSLDDPLATWLPALPAWSADVTVRHAMHHVSGIPDYVAKWATADLAWTEPRSKADTLAEIAAVEALDFPPGEQFAYSNSNYVLLSEVVRAVTGESIEDVVDERIFEPLRLDMRYDASGWDPDSTDPSSARGYVRIFGEGRWDPGGSRWEPNGDAGIQTTPSELVRWGDNYRTGEVGGDAWMRDLLAGTTEFEGWRYGAGVVDRGDGTLWHAGGAPGYLADFWISADRHTSVAVTCNADAGASSEIDYLATALQREWTR